MPEGRLERTRVNDPETHRGIVPAYVRQVVYWPCTVCGGTCNSNDTHCPGCGIKQPEVVVGVRDGMVCTLMVGDEPTLDELNRRTGVYDK